MKSCTRSSSAVFASVLRARRKAFARDRPNASIIGRRVVSSSSLTAPVRARSFVSSRSQPWCCSSSSLASSSTLDQHHPQHHQHQHRPQIYHTNNSKHTSRTAFGSLLHRAHRLLEELEEPPEPPSPLLPDDSDDDGGDRLPLRREALDCIFQLSRERTPAAVDLALLLLDQLVQRQRRAQQQRQQEQQQQQRQQEQQQQQNEQDTNNSAPSSSTDYSLLDRDLWHSVLINWQQVSREVLTEAVAPSAGGGSGRPPSTTATTATTTTDAQWERLDDQLTSPQKLLALLDGWSSGTIDRDGRPYQFATSKALSLILDVCGRRGKLLELLREQHQSIARHAVELRETADFAETVLLRMLNKHQQQQGGEPSNSQGHFLPSVDNLNMVLVLLGRTGQAGRAWRLLLTAADGGVPPDIFSYTALLKAYAATGDGAAAENVLQELLETSRQSAGGGAVVTPNVGCWNTVLAAWARADDRQLAAERVEQLLVTMMMMNHTSTAAGSRERSNNRANVHDDDDTTAGQSFSSSSTSITQQIPPVTPDLTTFNTALSAYARAGEADTCARLLGEMQDLYEAGRIAAPPDAISYSTTMNAFAKAGRPDQAEAYLEDMYAAFMQHGLQEMRPTLPLMTSVLDAYAKSIAKAVYVRDLKAMAKLLERARQMFQRMQAWHEYGFLPTRPDTTAFNVMMSCYLHAAHADTAPTVNRGAEHADALMRLLRAQALQQQQAAASNNTNTTTNARYMPDFSSYSIVIQAWLQRPDGFPHARRWLDEVWELHRAGTHPHICVDAKSLHSVMVGISHNHSAHLDAAERVLLNACEERRRDPTRTEAPRVASFGVLAAAWQRSGHPHAAERAQALVDQLEHYHQVGVLPEGPDRLVYSTLVNCWTHSNLEGAAERASSILTKMRQQAAKGDGSMEYPEITTYTNVIYAFSKGKVNAHRAEQVLRELYTDHKQGRLASSSSDDASNKLHIKCFNTALSAWARSRDRQAPERAEALFGEILRLEQNGEVECDTATYNTLLNSLAVARNRPSAERAERLVEQMMIQDSVAAAEGKAAPPPNAITFGSLIKAWVGLHDADRAERVLLRMCRAFLEEDNPDMHPQPRHFDQVERVLRSKDATASFSEQDRHKRLKALNDMRRSVLG